MSDASGTSGTSVSPVTPGSDELRSPRELRRRVDILQGRRVQYQDDLQHTKEQLASLHAYLKRAPVVKQALDQLSQTLFYELIGVLEDKLTLALQDVLEQPIRLRAESSTKRDRAHVDFHIERDGRHEDIMRGQGGSVKNVLSVGLRMFALTTLDERRHRRFLVLDEQDCWLRPDLVPKMVKIVHDAGKALGFQVLMISHHDTAKFEQYADRIYAFTPEPGGEVQVELKHSAPAQADHPEEP